MGKLYGSAVLVFLLLACPFESGAAQVSTRYPGAPFNCEPLSPAMSESAVRARQQREQHPTLCPRGQYPVAPEYVIAEMHCRPLPPAATAEVAKLFAESLEDRRICPPGKYPVRYGSGEDVRDGQICVVTPQTPDWWNWGETAPEADPESALRTARELARVRGCPYGARFM